MSDCVFCKIVAGELPCYKIYEDGLFLGFLDINPRTLGHSVLITKKHYKWVYDVPEFDKFWLAALGITKAMQKGLNPNFITYVTHGLEIPHAHIHIMPRENEVAFVPPQISVSKEKLEKIAKILYTLNHGAASYPETNNDV